MKMAGEEKLMFSFDATVNCRDALHWAADNRIAISSDSSVIVLTPKYSPDLVESEPCFHCSNIDALSSPYNMTGLSGQQFLDLQEKSSIDEKHEIGLDKTICPLLQTNVGTTGFRCVKWSPLGADKLNRCVLGVLSQDHRLSIYTTGQSLHSWKMIACLSDKYSESVEDVSNVKELRDRANRLSATGLAWSSCCCTNDEGLYCLLCVAMRNGDLVLWKVKLPVYSIDNCEVLKLNRFSSSYPTSLAFCKRLQHKTAETDILVVGYGDGTLYSSIVNLQDGSILSELCLHGDADSLEVSCVCSQALSEEEVVVLATKESFLMMYVVTVDVKKKLHLKLSSHVVMETSLYATGLSVYDKEICVYSHDADVQRGQLIVTDTAVDVKLLPLPVKHPVDGDSWSCKGGGVSPNSLFLAVAVSRTSFSNNKDPVIKKPLKLHIIQLQDLESIQKKIENLIQDKEVTSHGLPDVLEIVRENLLAGKNLISSTTDYLSQPELWKSLPLKVLRIIRYFLLARKAQSLTAQQLPEKTEEEKTEEENTTLVLQMVIARYISKCFQKFSEEKIKPTENDKAALSTMLMWTEKQEVFQTSPLNTHVNSIKKTIGSTPTQLSCGICSENCCLSSELLTSCTNGHSFGLCCQTLKPCDMPGYRVCHVCKAVAVAIETRREFPWLADDEHHCTLCGGLLT